MKEVKDAFQEMVYIDTYTDKKGNIVCVEKEFIATWLKDGNKRVYDTYNFLPPP